MRNFLWIVFLSVLLASCHQAKKSSIKYVDAFSPPISEERAIAKADSILGLLSLDDKLGLIKGYEGFYIKGLEKYGLPQLYLSDASQGVHIRDEFRDFHMGEQLEKSTAFPCPIQLASTWNPNLAQEYARAIGEECRAGGVGVLLGPGMNIYRVSQNGRNFEYMGEDPFLVSRMVEKYVVGYAEHWNYNYFKAFRCK